MTSLGEQPGTISFKTGQGLPIQATPVKLNRHAAVFEVYGGQAVLRTSEVLTDFRIMAQEQVLYSGRAVISNLINTGPVGLYEASLGDSWHDVDLFAILGRDGGLRQAFGDFFDRWQRGCRIQPDYKAVIADLQSYLADLRLWLEQAELGIRSSPSADRLQLERQVASELGPPVLATLTHFFEKFESIAAQVDDELRPAHQAYIKRQLHPLLLCSPFLYRTFQKPLGYAGDYEMVNMILRDPLEGASLFAKLVNFWFLQQPPAQAHRNRVGYLARKILEETMRCASERRTSRILSVGCGPAWEVRQSLQNGPMIDQTEFTLLDFSDECLAHTRAALDDLKRRNSRNCSVQLMRKSVNQLIKEDALVIENGAGYQYDLVYCAGLFDYLSDQVCRRLMNLLYRRTVPGGLLVATNVHDSNPRRLTMEYVMEWTLIYRDRARMERLHPEGTSDFLVLSDETGVNTYVEVRKPKSR
jgi:extracellular factor (EF) 3-hydroxypalmitic acid methyl ester biosynthesis protein